VQPALVTIPSLGNYATRSTMATRPMPRIILVLLLAAQGFLAFRFGGIDRPAAGDEPYYIHKARYIAEHHAFEPIGATELRVERGQAWGVSDWRPPGYPLFIALCAAGASDIKPMRLRVSAAQFFLLAILLFATFCLIEPSLPIAAPYAAAFLIGIAPWPFEFVTLIGPDSLNASMTLLGILVIWRARKARATFMASLLLMLTMMLRPEMVAIAPLVIAAAVALKAKEQWLTAGTAAVMAILLVLSSQLAYRRAVIGRWSLVLFGGLHIPDRGAFDWVHTWYGTEQQAYDFVYGLTNGNLRTELPDRAFADPTEREAIRGAVDEARRAGALPRSADEIFESVAAKRRREHPLTANIGPRIWHATHLWLNTETNTQLLNALSPWPKPARRVLLGALFVLKALLYLLYLYCLSRARKLPHQLFALVSLATVLIASRTLVIGIALNWMAHRYVVVAWPPLLVCAALSTALLLRPATSSNAIEMG
jgi:hypothetical protein